MDFTLILWFAPHRVSQGVESTGLPNKACSGLRDFSQSLREREKKREDIFGKAAK